MGLAPDAFSPHGGTPADKQDAFPIIRQMDRQATISNYIGAQKYLQSHPRSNGNVGVIGFCWGGAMTNQVAVNLPDLKAAVPFYVGQRTFGNGLYEKIVGRKRQWARQSGVAWEPRPDFFPAYRS